MEAPRRRTSPSGLTGLALVLGAIVYFTTADVIKEALESVPTKTVLTWCREKLDKTSASDAAHGFSPRSAMREQKQEDQSKAGGAARELVFIIPG